MTQCEFWMAKTSVSFYGLRALIIWLVFAVAGIDASVDGKPNILIILADDLGYSDLGCFGSEIETPNLDALAGEGIRYTDFYNTGRCWPTRSALMTGYYPQALNVDPLRRNEIRKWGRAIPEFLKPAGYRCYHSGKWHVFPFDELIKDAGFDRAYNLKKHSNYFIPKIHEENDVRLKGDLSHADYYATKDITDHLLLYLEEHDKLHASQPFFAYLAYIAPHFPLHAPADRIEKYRGKYDMGWDRLARERRERMEALGFPATTRALRYDDIYAPSGDPVKTKILGEHEVFHPFAWDDLGKDVQAFQSRKMEIHAAMIDFMDEQIGRVIDRIEEMGETENTVVLFLSDNGASAEILVRGEGHVQSSPAGSAQSFLCLGPGFAYAANTPFRNYKIWNYEGGIATPAILKWPNAIDGQQINSLDQTPLHVVDILPTLLDIVGIDFSSIKTRVAPTLHGRSWLPTITQELIQTVERPLFFQHAGNRALRLGRWKAVFDSDFKQWSLFDMKVDRGERYDVSNDHSSKVLELTQKWEELARGFRRQSQLN